MHHLYITIQIYITSSLVFTVYYYYDIHVSQHNSILYITILIYSNSYGSRIVYFYYDILFRSLSFILYITILIPYFISQPKMYITTLISDFLPLSLLFLKISAVPLVRRFFFTLFCCEMALLLGFGCETTPFLRFRSPFHYT